MAQGVFGHYRLVLDRGLLCEPRRGTVKADLFAELLRSRYIDFVAGKPCLADQVVSCLEIDKLGPKMHSFMQLSRVFTGFLIMGNTEDLVLGYLKRFQPGQERIEHKLEEVTRRLSNLEAGQASIVQHIGHLASADARQQLYADGFGQRLARIERTLELA